MPSQGSACPPSSQVQQAHCCRPWRQGHTGACRARTLEQIFWYLGLGSCKCKVKVLLVPLQARFSKHTKTECAADPGDKDVLVPVELKPKSKSSATGGLETGSAKSRFCLSPLKPAPASTLKQNVLQILATWKRWCLSPSYLRANLLLPGAWRLQVPSQGSACPP